MARSPHHIAPMILCSLMHFSASLFATEYYVSPSGNNSTGNGTMGSPWGTVQYAVDRISPGDILYLRGGEYHEQLISVRSGTPGSPITIAAFGNEDAVIDGSGVATGNNGVLISHSYLILRGFTVRDWVHNGIEGFNCAFVEFRNLKVTAVTGGIALTGTVHDFVVDSCIIHDYFGGAGGFGFDATPQEAADSIYNGVISNCKAYITAGAYDNCDGFALGHDGVSNIRIEDCQVYGVGDAFDISGVDIVLERCSAHHSSYGGGYKLWRESVTMVNCVGHSNIVNVELDYDSEVNRGVHARLINCTFYNPGDANILIENSAGGSTLEMYNCILAGGENTGLYFDGNDVRGYTGDYNLFHLGTAERMIAISDRDFSLAQVLGGEWSSFSGQDSHTRVVFSAGSIFQDTNVVNPDLHLREGAPAIDNGTSLHGAPSVDFENHTRSVGPIDIGAFEFGAGGVSGVSDPSPGSGGSFRLEQNYPNPFNPSTTICFTLPRASCAVLRIFDTLGREVEALFSGELGAGTHAFRWEGANRASGAYWYQLRAGTGVETRKLVLVK